MKKWFAVLSLLCVSQWVHSQELRSPYSDDGELVACQKYVRMLSDMDAFQENYLDKTSEEVARSLANLFKSAAETFSDRVAAIVQLVRYDGRNFIYIVNESDTQYSSRGGATFLTAVDSKTGLVSSVDVIGCWDSGE